MQLQCKGNNLYSELFFGCNSLTNARTDFFPIPHLAVCRLKRCAHAKWNVETICKPFVNLVNFVNLLWLFPTLRQEEKI